VNDGGARPVAYAHLDYLPELLVNQEGLINATLEVSSSKLSVQAINSRLGELDALMSTTTPWKVTRKDTVGQLAAEVSATRSSFMTVGVLSLLVTAFAVANVGLSALRERSVELSLRRALGGRRWQIPGLMILESQIVALIAGSMAVPVSYLIYPLVAEQFGAPFGIDAPAYPWGSALLGLSIGMLTALVGSIAPAIRALNTPISSMMRE
jgi:putative ABC transport system permease protein